MPLFDFRSPHEALESLLDCERNLILEGDLSALAKLVREKERLAGLLEMPKAGAPRLQALRRKADRNQALLSQAQRGIARARERLEVLRNGPAPMRTYSRDGMALSLSAGGRRTDVNHKV